MRTILWAPLLCLTGLAACNSQPVPSSDNAASGSSAATSAETRTAQAVDTTFKLQPGEWSVKTDVTQLDMPGAGDPRISGAIGDMMKKRQSIAVSHCLTQAQAATPPNTMFGGRDGAECRRDRLVMAGGRIDSAMTCARGKDEGTMTVAVSGTYSATGYDLASDMKVTNPQMPGGAMTMKARVTGKRIGECKA